MLYESMNDWKRYDFGPTWIETMSWVDEHKASVDLGTFEVSGCKITVSEATTKLVGTARYECHHRMADVQIVLQGEEDLYNLPAEGLTPEPFNEERDLGFFTEPVKYSPIRLFPGVFALLLPWDAHMPSMAVGNTPALVKKLLIKLPVDRLVF